MTPFVGRGAALQQQAETDDLCGGDATYLCGPVGVFSLVRLDAPHVSYSLVMKSDRSRVAKKF